MCKYCFRSLFLHLIFTLFHRLFFKNLTNGTKPNIEYIQFSRGLTPLN
jgi:hypothetical protein